MITCQLHHLSSQTIWETNFEVHPDSEEYVMFQNSDNPADFGYTFVGPYPPETEE